MPAYKKLGINKIRPKKPNPGGKLLSLGKGFTTGVIKTIQKGFSSLEVTPYSQITNGIRGILMKLSISPDKFKTLLLDEIFKKNSENLNVIMAYATHTGIIENRLMECFRFSISSNPKMVEQFFRMNKMTETRVLHILTIINKMLLNLTVDEVERKSFDKDEKELLNCIIYQFTDPASSRMGISKSDVEVRFDFFREWCSKVFTHINPDVSLRSGSGKKTKKPKKKTKKPKKKKKCTKKCKKNKCTKKCKKNKCTKKCKKKKSKKSSKKRRSQRGGGPENMLSIHVPDKVARTSYVQGGSEGYLQSGGPQELVIDMNTTTWTELIDRCVVLIGLSVLGNPPDQDLDEARESLTIGGENMIKKITDAGFNLESKISENPESGDSGGDNLVIKGLAGEAAGGQTKFKYYLIGQVGREGAR